MFFGLNRYRIGIPDYGYSYLYVNLSLLEGCTAMEGLEKLESLGYEPKLRFYDNGETLFTCALLKVAPATANPYEDLLISEFETLAEMFGDAVQCATRRPKGTPRPEFDPELTVEIGA